MDSEKTMKAPEFDLKNTIIDDKSDVVEGTTSAIYVDPVLEKSAMKKFDRYVLPVSVIFLVLSSLDRNNVSLIFVLLL
jgi:hypothetical protein